VNSVATRSRRLVSRSKTLGLFSARRNAEFWEILAEAHLIGKQQSVMRRASSTKYLRALNQLSLFAAQVQSRHGLSLALGRYTWLDLGKMPAGLDPALGLARAALAIEKPALAQRLAEQITQLRPRSRAAWRLLADAHDAQGHHDDAVKAAGRFAHLAGANSAAAAPAGPSQLDIADVLKQHIQADAPSGAADWYQQLLALRRGGDGIVVDTAAASNAFVLQPLTKRKVVSGAAGVVVRESLASGHAPDLSLREISQALVRAESRQAVPTVTRETARAIVPMDVGGLREYLRGKSVCLVANSARVGESDAGALIDSYDVVARFNSFRIDPAQTGSKTSLHATIHLHKFNWSVPVDVRLVFSGNANAWRDSVNKFVDPSAQRYLGDRSLRWPVRDSALVGDTGLVDVPTSGFNLLRLIDLLDVSSAIDLIGFDFNQSGAYRLESAMRLPVAKAHDYSAEKDWVVAHATRVTDLVISLR